MQLLYTVSILFVDQPEMTVECIQKVLDTSSPDETRVLVTANGSSKEDINRVTRPFINQRVEVLVNPTNLGFGVAHNFACRDAEGRSVYFVALNNDCFVSPGWLEALRRPFTQDSKVAQTGIESTCGALDTDGKGIVGSVREYIEASCMMMPTWLARRFGPFSEDFRMIYCEDADLSLRLREAGYTIEAVNCDVRHTRAATTSRLTIDMAGFRARNHALLKTKWQRYLYRRNFSYKIAVHRSGAVGDVLLTTPIIHALKRRYADAEIRASSHHRYVFNRNPDVTRNDFDPLQDVDGYWKVLDLDLAYEKAPMRHLVQAYADAARVDIDISNPDDLPRVTLAETDRNMARALMDDTKPSAVMHIGPTAWVGRNLEPWKFEQIGDFLRERHWSIVQVGAEGPALKCADLNLVGTTDFHQLAAVIERSSLFVGLDSMPMHLAQAFRRPTVGVFGCIDPALRLYQLPYVRGVVAEDVGCLGCHHVLPAPRTSSYCLRDRVHCMERLRVRSVLEAIDAVLEAYMIGREASKIRDHVLKYCAGKGIDIGAKDDKIKQDAIGFDRNPGPGIDRVGDASVKMPYEPDTFDYVFSSHCLEDIADTQATLREWLRILKVGGYIVLYVPHPDLYHGCNYDHKHDGFRPEELSAMLLKQGCKIIESYAHNRPPDWYSTLVVGEKVPQ